MTTIFLLLFISSVSMYMYFMLQTNRAVARFKRGAKSYITEFKVVKRKLSGEEKGSISDADRPINITDFKPVIKPIFLSSVAI